MSISDIAVSAAAHLSAMADRWAHRPGWQAREDLRRHFGVTGVARLDRQLRLAAQTARQEVAAETRALITRLARDQRHLSGLRAGPPTDKASELVLIFDDGSELRGRTLTARAANLASRVSSGPMRLVDTSSYPSGLCLYFGGPAGYMSLPLSIAALA